MLHAKVVLLIAVSFVFATTSSTQATTYFVRASGDDARDGLSPATAFATIRPAALLLQNPGDRLVVGPGTYHEGNIKPRGSGSIEAPIVLHADVSGELTGDPAGPVLIVPPNTADATTGIIVYGRSDIVIEGFDVDGAADAGIQVRPHSVTGVYSTRVVVRNNNTRNGARKGIHVVGTGDVSIAGNTASRNAGVGIAVAGGPDTRLAPSVSDNRLEENRFGIALRETTGGTVTRNTLRSNYKGVTLRDCDTLTISNNDIAALSFGGLTGSGSNLTVTDNVIERAGLLELTGANQFINTHFARIDVTLRLYANLGTLLLQDNTLPRTYVWSKRFDVRGNTGELFNAGGEAATIVDNTFRQSIESFTTTTLEMSGNTTGYIEARAPAAVVRNNQVAGFMDVLSANATVTDNRAKRVLVARYSDYRESDDPNRSRGPYLVENNTSDTMVRLGESVAPLASAVVRNNVAGEMVKVFGRGVMQVTGNEAHGIACTMSGANSRLTVSGNTSRQSPEAGLIAIGAQTAVIANNTATDNSDSGLAARDIHNLTVSGNTLRGNPAGGISVLAPLAGDCNSNLAVSVDEIVTSVRIALDQRPLYVCRAADHSRDGRVTIDELVLAAGAAADRPTTQSDSVEIRGNRIEDNGRFGINLFSDGALLVADNTILRNGGIALAMNGRNQDGSAILGNVIGSSNAEGLLLKSLAAARVRNNTIFSNREAGLLLRDAPRATIVNNLIYANGDDGVSLGVGSELPANDAMVANNTIYANAGWGVTIGTKGTASTGTVVLNNIIDGNLRGGVAAVTESADAIALDFNLRNDDNYETLPSSESDFKGDPRFVGAAGPDGVLGGNGFADDDLHLQPGQPKSAAIDAGSGTPAELGITGSAVAGQTTDTGIVDVGFHYGASE